MKSEAKIKLEVSYDASPLPIDMSKLSFQIETIDTLLVKRIEKAIRHVLAGGESMPPKKRWFG